MLSSVFFNMPNSDTSHRSFLGRRSGTTVRSLLSLNSGASSFNETDSDYKSAHRLNTMMAKGGNVERFAHMVEWSPMRLYAHDIVESSWFGGTILGIILLNTILIALQTDRSIEIDYGMCKAFICASERVHVPFTYLFVSVISPPSAPRTFCSLQLAGY